MKIIAKGSQNGAEIDAKTHQKINARTGIEKDQGNHQTSCFFEE